MLWKFVIKYGPLLYQCQKRGIFMSITLTGRGRNRLNPYSSVLKDDMLNLSPEEVQEEITFMSNMPLQGIMDRQNLAEKDIKLLMKRGKFKNIERKYFKKEPEPCFLTSSMIEQIRSLHMLDSILWTPVNLSYVFPASLPEIKKLITEKPSNLSEERLKIHDKKVLENWKRYAKDQFGSIPLLKKTIEMRFSEVSETKLSTTTMSGNQEVINFLDSLKFTEEDDDIAFSDEKSKKHLKKLFKSNYPFKETFRDIITNYEHEVAKLKALESGKEEENLPQNETAECKILSEVLPVYKKEFPGSYIKVSVNDEDSGIDNYAPNSSLGKKIDDGVATTKNITYEDFINLKEDPNVKSKIILNLLNLGDLENAFVMAKELLLSNANIPTYIIKLLLQHLSESGDFNNIEFIGNQLCEEIRAKSKIMDQLVFAYQKMGKTDIFFNRVLNHFRGHCKETLVNIIPYSALPNILVKEPNLEACVRECARLATTGGDTRMMAGLLNTYLILMKFNKADEIYKEYFENQSRFNISVVCHQGYHDSNYQALNAILELVNRHPNGREKMKAFIYSTLIDLYCKESKFEEANKVIESLPLQNLELNHIRRGVIENLKLKMEKNGVTFPYDINC